MSHELFELFGMLGAGAGLTALFQRTLQPVLLRIAAGRRGSACPRAAERAPDAGRGSNALSAHGTRADGFDPTI